MFVWWSNGSGSSRIGCCGGLLFLPLGLLFFTGDFGGGSWLIWLGLAALVAFLILPQLTRSTEGYEKRKNEAYGDYDAYGEKPKREADRYILTDDGEVIEANDEDASHYDSGMDRQ